MAESMTYDSLVSDIISYAERNNAEFTAQVPRFIMMAENKLASTIRGLGYLQVVESAMVLHESSYQKPTRWRETASLSITTDSGLVYLKPRTYEFCRAYTPTTTAYGQPRYYCDYGYEHFLVAAVPDDAYPFELMYFERPDPLSDTNQTSWTTQYAPQLLLYSSLLEAQPYLKNPEIVAQYQGLFNEAAQMVANESTRRQVDHTEIRSPE